MIYAVIDTNVLVSALSHHELHSWNLCLMKTTMCFMRLR